MNKSKRHSKILGDFGEMIIMYWLSKRNYEPVLVDYTGIDIVSYSKSKDERIGVSVKSRTRKKGTEEEKITVPSKNVPKIKHACNYFDCKPYFGCVIDKNFPQIINIYLIPLKDILKINEFEEEKKSLYIRFKDDNVKQYKELKESFIINMNYEEIVKNM